MTRAGRDASRLEPDGGIVIGLYAGGLDGWDAGARALGLEPAVGIEWDAAACATRRAAGLPTIQADVAELDPLDFAPVRGITGGPPCQPFSPAGKGAGRDALPFYEDAIVAAGEPLPRDELDEACADPRAHHILEPLRWALALRPAWIALEQVDAVLPLWRAMAAALRAHGYHTWTGNITAEQYGTPQTRKRALLLASLEHAVARPPATHQRFVAPRPPRQRKRRPRGRSQGPVHPRGTIALDGAEAVPVGRIVHPEDRHLKPWRSMADALGWHEDVVVSQARGAGMVERYGDRRSRRASEPAPTVTGSGDHTGGPRWRIEYDSRSQRDTRSGEAVPHRRRGLDEPAPTIAVESRNDAWVLRAGGNTKGGTRPEGLARDLDEPAFTVTTRADEWTLERPAALEHGNQHNATVRSIDEPAATLAFGKTAGQSAAWVHHRPATTIACDERIPAPGHKGDVNGGERGAKRQMDEAIRLAPREALILQGFPDDWPVQGSQTKVFEQIGNAWPPQPARAALAAVGADRRPTGPGDASRSTSRVESRVVSIDPLRLWPT